MKYGYALRKKRRIRKSILLCGVVFVLIVIIGVIFNYKDTKEVGAINYNAIVDELDFLEIIKEGVLPDEVYGVPVHTQLIEVNPETRTGTKRLIQYIIIHETDNYIAGVGAKNHASYLSYNNDSDVSWHYTVDDHEIYHHIPDDEVAHHAGELRGNEFGIGIELCVNVDGDFEKTFENGAKLVAYLLKAYDLNINAVKTHRDFNGKDCPHYIFEDNRWDEFKELIASFLNK